MPYVYTHSKKGTKEVFYIGIGSDTEYKRANTHSSRNRFWRHKVNKYGVDVSVILDNISWEDACKWESYLIGIYGRGDLKKGFLVNLTDGGEGRVNHILSEETRLKMGKAQLGNKKYLLRTTPQEEINKKISLANSGRVMSEEQKEKIKNYFKTNGHPSLGKKASDETREKIAAARRRRILQFDLNNNFIKEWGSILEAKKAGYCNAAIWRCLRGIYKHHKESIWKYKN